LSDVTDVLEHYGLDGQAEEIDGGLINTTYRISDAAGSPVAVIQKLHPIFGARVNDDIDAITSHLAARGLVTPRVLVTTAGARWVEHGGATWRGLSFVVGETIHTVSSPAVAEAAGELVGRFHRAVDGLDHEFAFVRQGVHDTPGFLAKLAERVKSPPGEPWSKEAAQLGQEILEAADSLPPLGDLPVRVTHGDLKISNVLFESLEPPRALCLIDLDTLGRQTMAYELGDALRSWCNPAGENVPEPRADASILAATLTGYARGSAGLLSSTEVESLVPGLETVCIELAARFCNDVFDDSYFGWDAKRFASRREHNLLRAKGQLALGRSVSTRRDELTTTAVAAFE
jgi:Ser/Thr protein kinase RdoA (MazF antagonist)